MRICLCPRAGSQEPRRARIGHSEPIEFITAAARLSVCLALRLSVVHATMRQGQKSTNCESGSKDLPNIISHLFCTVCPAASVSVHTQTEAQRKYPESGNFINSIVIGPATDTTMASADYVHWHNYGPFGNMRHCSDSDYDHGCSDYGSSCCPKIANRRDNKST